MAAMNIKAEFDEGKGYGHQQAIDRAKTASSLTARFAVDALEYLTEEDTRQENVYRRFTDAGRKGHQNLVDTLVSIFLQQNMYSLKTPDSVRKELMARLPRYSDPSKDQFSNDETLTEHELNDLMDKHGLKTKLKYMWSMNTVEGVNVGQIYHDKETGKTGYRVFPLNSLRIKTNNGDVTSVILKNRLPDLPGEEKRYIYRKVDFETDKVYYQICSENMEYDVKEDPMDRTIYYTVWRKPCLFTYPMSFVYERIGKIIECNELTNRLMRIASACGTLIVGLDSNAKGITLAKLQDAVDNGRVIRANVTPDGRIDGIGVISFASKSTDYANVNQRVMQLEDEVVMMFGGGIAALYQSLPQPRSASEVNQTVDELNRFISGIGSDYVPPLQRTVEGYLALYRTLEETRLQALGAELSEADMNIIPWLAGVTITSGSTQLTQLQNVSRELQRIGITAQYKQDFLQFRVNWEKVWNLLGNSYSLENSNLLYTEEEAQQRQQAFLQSQQEQNGNQNLGE